MAAHDAQRDELVDGAVLVDDEVRARGRQLVQLGVGDVAGEGVVGRLEGVGHRVVLDDDLRVIQAEVVDAVVAPGVGAHLLAARGPEGDRALDDRRASGRRPRRDRPRRDRRRRRRRRVGSWRRRRCALHPRGCAWRCARPPTAWERRRGRRRRRRVCRGSAGATAARSEAAASSATAIAAGRRTIRSRRRRRAPARGAQLVVGVQERALGLRGRVVGAQGVVEDLGDVALEVAALVCGRAVLQVAVVVQRALEGLHEQVLDRPGGVGLRHGQARAAVSAACRLATTWSMPARAASGRDGAVVDAVWICEICARPGRAPASTASTAW